MMYPEVKLIYYTLFLAGGADVRAMQLPSTEEHLVSGLVQPFTVTPTTETVEIKPSLFLFHPTGS